MRPDEREMLDRIEAELTAAGASVRRRPDARPDVAFAVDLRRELLAELPPVPVAPPARVRWSFGELFRGRRLAPVLAVGVLAVAVGAAARTVIVGMPPDATLAPSSSPSPSPTVTARPVVIGDPDGRIVATPTPSPSPTASPTPTASPSPTPTPTPSPTPTPKPTAKPTQKPTPVPTPIIGSMELALTGCNGGVVLDWTKVGDGRFHHYRTLRSTVPSMATAVELAGSKTSDAGVLGAADTSGTPGTVYFYRSQALDAGGSVIATSSVQSAKSKPVAPMTLSATPADPGTTTFAWSKYGGPASCFTYYKLAYSETNPSPSYLAGDPTWAVIGDQSASATTVAGPVSGTTYFVRMQAIRSTPLGSFVVAQSDVVSYTAP